MSYIANKPDSGPSPKLDAPIIQSNFSVYATVFGVNHTAMNKANQGNHEAVVLNLQADDPGVTQDLNVLFCKNVTSKAGTQPQLFVQIPEFLPTDNDPTKAENVGMQLTFNQVNTSGPIYQSFLPGGYVLYFGSATDITMPIIVSPAPTKLIVAVATSNGFTGAGLPFNVSTTINTTLNDRFTINSTFNGTSPGSYSFGWWAIGIQ